MLHVLMGINYIVVHILVSRAYVPLSPGQFECPLVPFTPCLGIYANFILGTAGLTGSNWYKVAIFQALGIIFYLCYGLHHSTLRK
jgi:hypothetical protein